MAARSPRAGIRHLTVVPTNYEPTGDSENGEGKGEPDADPSLV